MYSGISKPEKLEANKLKPHTNERPKFIPATISMFKFSKPPLIVKERSIIASDGHESMNIELAKSKKPSALVISFQDLYHLLSWC